jgi:hypothetical protein
MTTPKQTVPNPCSVCGGPIFGSVIGTGDGSMRDGGSFAHPECYWKEQACELVAERAALLATRDRYEAALRQIANAEFPYHPDSVPWQAKVAREALAAAQEGDNG